MWHRANDFIRSNIYVDNGQQVPNKNAVQGYAFTHQERTLVTNELHVDASSYLYSGLVSFLDALQGLQAGFYSWPTVKLYYAIFYACRAYLAACNICLFYVGRSSYSVDLGASAPPRSQGGNTHKAVLELFRTNCPGNVFLTQEIEMQDPFEWFTYKREYCNYKQPKFCEPNIPAHFEKLDSLGTDVCLNVYYNDHNNYLAFDEDHAIIAYPFGILLNTIDKFVQVGLEFDEPELRHLRSMIQSLNISETLFKIDFSAIDDDQ